MTDFVTSMLFQSTLPVRGATVSDDTAPPELVISIHAPREGSDDGGTYYALHGAISIHAPREGSDRLLIEPYEPVAISIHAPREGSDHQGRSKTNRKIFQSTLPVRGATVGA